MPTNTLRDRLRRWADAGCPFIVDLAEVAADIRALLDEPPPPETRSVRLRVVHSSRGAGLSLRTMDGGARGHITAEFEEAGFKAGDVLRLTVEEDET